MYACTYLHQMQYAVPALHWQSTAAGYAYPAQIQVTVTALALPGGINLVNTWKPWSPYQLLWGAQVSSLQKWGRAGQGVTPAAMIVLVGSVLDIISGSHLQWWRALEATNSASHSDLLWGSEDPHQVTRSWPDPNTWGIIVDIYLHFYALVKNIQLIMSLHWADYF